MADKDRVLTVKGYAIKKESLTEPQIRKLRSDLTMTPKVLDKFQMMIPTFPIYLESKARFYVPRQWGRKQFGEPEADIVSEGLPLPDAIAFRTTFPPHDFQKEIMTTFLAKGANGLICVPCGYGKTYMALNIAVQLKKRFLIIVDKEFLMNQWKAEIENFIEGARVGILQSSTCQVGTETITDKEYTLPELKQIARDAKLKVGGSKEILQERLQAAGIDIKPKSHIIHYDITICMIQTICRQEFPDGFFDDYGFTIFDECHHLGASYFCKALQKVQTKYILGLSATPDRDDGLSCVFEAYLGDPVYKNTQREPDHDAIVKAIWFTSEDPIYKDVPVDWRGEPVTAKLLNQIAEFEPRNKKIVQHIEEYINDPNRYILLISDRISQLDWFYKEITSNYLNCKVGYYIGGIKQSVLDETAESCKVLLATYQMVAEGFSVKKLNTIVLSTPRKKVEQASGRIFRERISERKVAPHIIDVIDSHNMLINRWRVRQRFYNKCEYIINHIDRPNKHIDRKEDSDDEKEEQFLFKF